MTNEISSPLSQHKMDISAVPLALKVVGKYLMRSFTRGHDPMYDAVLTISSVGVQVPLFFLKKVTDDYSTTILSNNNDGLKFKNHHYTQTQTLVLEADITSARSITTSETTYGAGEAKYTYVESSMGENVAKSEITLAPHTTETTTPIHHKTSEHDLLKAVGVLATVLNLAHNFDDLDGVLSSAPSVAIHRTNFENPFAYDPASDSAIFRIFMDVIMQQGILVDFESPTKVYKNMMIKKLNMAPINGVLGVNHVTLTLEQTNIQDFEVIKFKK